MDSKYRILMVHNYYQQRGGEDEQTEQDIQVLRDHQHEVKLYSRNNYELNQYSRLHKLLLFFEPSWSAFSAKKIQGIISEYKPDLVHVQNFFPLISPAVFHVCAENKIPVVYTLHNYRLFCPTSIFFRDHSICEECLNYSLLRGIQHKCYHRSYIQTLSVALMLGYHRFIKTWSTRVNTFIALSQFSYDKFIQAGLPSSKIMLKPNFLYKDPGIGNVKCEYALFIGRLSEEKGLITLLEAWKHFPNIPLEIIGDGPLRPVLENIIRINNLNQVKLIGFVPLDEVLTHLKKALFLVMPSLWYETFGRTIIEAYACGIPVIASQIGAIEELVSKKSTGLLFSTGNVNDLICKIEFMSCHPEERNKLGKNARILYEQMYTAENGYINLLNIYERTLNNNFSGRVLLN